MLVLAIAPKGKEFIYSASSARQVSKNSAEKIKNTLNELKYRLKDGYIWHLYDVTKYDKAYDYAQFQRFTIRKGVIKDKRC